MKEMCDCGHAKDWHIEFTRADKSVGDPCNRCHCVKFTPKAP